MPFSDELLREIHETCVEQGGLYKKALLTGFELEDKDYNELKEAILARFGDLELGPRGKGGFQVKKRRGPRTEAEPIRLTSADRWERIAAAYLTENLQHRDLEELLGSLAHALRAARAHRYGEERRGTKQELAQALITSFGADLLARRERRQLIAQCCKVKKSEVPDRWEPGKFGARRFVNQLGLPIELAGIPSAERKEDIEILHGQVRLPALLDFQEEVKEKTLKLIEAGKGRGILSLPTGAGKTRVAVETLLEWFDRHADENDTVLWLAHTEELCEQAAQCFREVWLSRSHPPVVEMVRFWGRYSKDLYNPEFQNVLESPEPQVFISTPQRIRNVLTGEDTCPKTAEMISQARVVLIDEAHRAAAEMYRNIVQIVSNQRPDLFLFGLTATPFRKEYDPLAPERGTEELRQIFEKLIIPSDTLAWPFYVSLQDREVLSCPEHHKLDTEFRIRLQDITPNLDNILKIRTDRHIRRAKILPAVQSIASNGGSSILYFGPTVEDARAMAFLLRMEGINALAVAGDTNTGTRMRLVEDFRSNKVQVLCNCEVLTTGFDAPLVTHVVMARPTVSQVLYEQMIGRGLRGPKFGGTERCQIVDCVDEYTGRKPELGYDQHLDIWQQETG